MVLPTTGQLSLDDIHVEAGGTTLTACTINDADIRGLSPGSGKTINTTPSSQVSIDDFYGAQNLPSPVARVLWEEVTATDPNSLGLYPTGIVQANALVPSGSPDNIASTSTNINVLFLVGNYYAMQLELKVNAINSGNFTRFYNPKARWLFDISNWSTISTDLGCKIKLTLGVSMTSSPTVTGTPTHAANYYPQPGGTLTDFITGSGGTFSGSNVTVTTTQTVNDYIINNQDLELRMQWAEGGTLNYLRYVGSAEAQIEVQKVEFVL